MLGAGGQERPFDVGNRLIAALDVPDRDEADALLGRLGHAASFIKIGLELFIAGGPELVRAYVAAGHRVMLDLKLHDIPATVARATERAASLGAELLTVHAAGGRDMLRAACEAAERAGQGATRATRILAVTVLTSLDARDLVDIGVHGAMEDVVLGRARLAMDAGCDGVVASPVEAGRVRAMALPGFLIVTPGVRPQGTSADDQKRVLTPAEARRQGADLVVCGRPIRDAADPRACAAAIARELASVE